MALSESQPGRTPYRERRSFSTRTGVPPLAQTTFPACRAHYPGGPEPVHVSVASRSVRPCPLPVQAACQLPDLPTTIWVGLPPTGDLRRWGAQANLALQ